MIVATYREMSSVSKRSLKTAYRQMMSPNLNHLCAPISVEDLRIVTVAGTYLFETCYWYPGKSFRMT